MRMLHAIRTFFITQPYGRGNVLKFTVNRPYIDPLLPLNGLPAERSAGCVIYYECSDQPAVSGRLIANIRFYVNGLKSIRYVHIGRRYLLGGRNFLPCGCDGFYQGNAGCNSKAVTQYHETIIYQRRDAYRCDFHFAHSSWQQPH